MLCQTGVLSFGSPGGILGNVPENRESFKSIPAFFQGGREGVPPGAVWPPRRPLLPPEIWSENN